MAYDEALAGRIRAQLGKRAGLTERRIFGGVAFLLKGNIVCGVHGVEMIVRLSPDETDAALENPHTRVFDLSGGRPMKGWLLVKPEGLKSPAALKKWVDVGLDYAASLPAK